MLSSIQSLHTITVCSPKFLLAMASCLSLRSKTVCVRAAHLLLSSILQLLWPTGRRFPLFLASHCAIVWVASSPVTVQPRVALSSLMQRSYADDAVLYTTSHENLCTMANEFISCASDWGLTVSITKTKAMSVGPGRVCTDLPVLGGDDVISCQDDFTYLGSNISGDGQLDHEIASRLAKASRAFGSLADPIFRNTSLSLGTRRYVYQACVLMVLFYASESWTLKAPQLHRLEVFHHHCIRVILGVSRDQQWQDRISSEELARRFGMPSSMAEVVRCHRLRWLGHLGRMEDSRLPKRVLFAEGLNTRPSHGPKKRWRDIAAAGA
eukprot:scpid83525/ scgid6249/ Putative uncharacterized transposon-derived protein F52C9.6